MMFRDIRLACLSSLVFLAGCASFRNATTVLNPQGPAALAPSYAVPNPTTDPGQIGLFEASYGVALQDQKTISLGTRTPPTSSSDAVSIHARQMAIDGFHLTDDYCADFFRTAGTSQKWLDVIKDLTAVIGTAATGALAFSSPANASASGIVALTTATTYNGVDLYTRNFLFGSDNIESVRQLTMNALAVHKSSVLPNNDTTVWSFGGAAEAINDHQDICSPASIRALVLAAIKGGTVTAYQPAGTALVAAATAGATSVAAATQAAAAAAPDAPPAVAAAAATAAATAGITAAPAVSPVSGVTATALSEAAGSVVLAKAVAAASAAGATPTEAHAAGAAAANIVTSAITAAAANVASSSSRHINIQVNGQSAVQ